MLADTTQISDDLKPIHDIVYPYISHERRKVFLKHSPIPGFIHDICGYFPLLCNRFYTQYTR